MTVTLMLCAWLVPCALWPYWAATTVARVRTHNSRGPACRNCRGTPKAARAKQATYDDILARTCEGALLLAVHNLRRAGARLGAADCPDQGDLPATRPELSDDELAEIATPFVTHRRIPWVLGGIVRRFSDSKTWHEFALLFGPPIMLSAIVGPMLLSGVLR